MCIRDSTRIDNPKYKARFGCKARMLAFEEVEPEIGHAVGGVIYIAKKPNLGKMIGFHAVSYTHLLSGLTEFAGRVGASLLLTKAIGCLLYTSRCV